MPSYPDYDEMTPSEYDAAWQAQSTFASLTIGGVEVIEKCIITKAQPSAPTVLLPLEMRLPAIMLLNELHESDQVVKNGDLLAFLQNEYRDHPREMTSWFLEVSQALLPPKRSVTSLLLGRAPGIRPKWSCEQLTVDSRTDHVVVIRGTVSPVSEPAA